MSFGSSESSPSHFLNIPNKCKECPFVGEIVDSYITERGQSAQQEDRNETERAFLRPILATLGDEEPDTALMGDYLLYLNDAPDEEKTTDKALQGTISQLESFQSSGEGAPNRNELFEALSSRYNDLMQQGSEAKTPEEIKGDTQERIDALTGSCRKTPLVKRLLGQPPCRPTQAS